MTIANKSVLTFEKCPRVADLKLKTQKIAHSVTFLQFQLCHQRAQPPGRKNDVHDDLVIK